jgi:hypothetical protein
MKNKVPDELPVMNGSTGVDSTYALNMRVSMYACSTPSVEA